MSSRSGEHPGFRYVRTIFRIHVLGHHLHIDEQVIGNPSPVVWISFDFVVLVIRSRRICTTSGTYFGWLFSLWDSKAPNQQDGMLHGTMFPYFSVHFTTGECRVCECECLSLSVCVSVTLTQSHSQSVSGVSTAWLSQGVTSDYVSETESVCPDSAILCVTVCVSLIVTGHWDWHSQWLSSWLSSLVDRLGQGWAGQDRNPKFTLPQSRSGLSAPEEQRSNPNPNWGTVHLPERVASGALSPVSPYWPYHGVTTYNNPNGKCGFILLTPFNGVL